MKIEDALEKKFGKDIFFAGDRLLEEEKQIISVSPALDIALGGGIPLGSFVVITGKPKIGKSSLCLHIAKNAQELGIKTYYLSVEGRLKKRDIQGIEGLKTDKDSFEVIASQKGNILYAEDYLDILNSYAEVKENSVFIVDSISQLCSKARKANTIGDRFRDDVPLFLADMTKRLSNLLPVNNNIVICITHLIANQGGMSKREYNEASGNKVQYQADVKLKALYSEAYKIGEEQVGQIVHWECENNALNVAPHKKAQSLLRYGYGIDKEYEILNMCISIGIINQGGAWITIPKSICGQENDLKLHGQEKARTFLVQNQDILNIIYDKLKESLGIKL